MIECIYSRVNGEKSFGRSIYQIHDWVAIHAVHLIACVSSSSDWSAYIVRADQDI